MTMTRDEAQARWYREAREKITTHLVVEGRFASVVVLVEGIKVAEFSTFAALVTKDAATRAAEDYATTLRQAYFNLAAGIPIVADGWHVWDKHGNHIAGPYDSENEAEYGVDLDEGHEGHWIGQVDGGVRDESYWLETP